MNLSSVSNLAVNNSTSTDLSSTRQSESAGSFEQMLSAQKETSSHNDNAAVDSNAASGSNANNQQTAESSASQPSSQQQPVEHADATKADAEIADDGKTAVEETGEAQVFVEPNTAAATLKNTPIVDKSIDDKNDADEKLKLDVAQTSMVDDDSLSVVQDTTVSLDDSALSSDTPDEATQSLMAMLNQAQAIKTDTTSNVSTTVSDGTLTPAQSVDALLTQTEQIAPTDVTAESDAPLTPFTLADTDGRQIRRADMDMGKKIEIAINSGDSGDSSAAIDKSALTSVVVKNSESLTASNGSNTSPLMASPQTLATSAQPTTVTTPSAATTSTAMLNAQVGSEAWQQTLGQQVVMFARDGQQSAKLRLHPEELGALQINLTLNNDNEAQLHFVSAHSQVRAALEAALPHLRTSLAESGIDLGQASVGSESSQSRTQDQQTSDSGFVHQSENVTPDGSTTPLSVPTSLQQMASGVTGINTFA